MMWSRWTKLPVLSILVALGLAACGDKEDPYQPLPDVALDGGATVTYCSHIGAIFDEACAQCHGSTVQGADRQGAPTTVDLDTFAGAMANAERSNVRIQAGTMPPGSPLSAEDKALVKAWLDAGTPEGCDAEDVVVAVDTTTTDLMDSTASEEIVGADTVEVLVPLDTTETQGGADTETVAPVDTVAEVDAGGSPEVVDPNCASGSYWSPGVAGPLMQPGKDCLSCHAGSGGPTLTIAGTVMGAFHDVDLCKGVPGVTVEITDAMDEIHTFLTNDSGNFVGPELEGGVAAIPTPVSVRLVLGDAERVMGGQPSTTNCMSCHTTAGANGAPGRIVAP